MKKMFLFTALVFFAFTSCNKLEDEQIASKENQISNIENSSLRTSDNDEPVMGPGELWCAINCSSTFLISEIYGVEHNL